MAQDSAPRRAAPCSGAREPGPRVTLSRMPIGDPVPSISQATHTHEQSTALHMQHCAHNTQAQALHRHIGGSSTRASPANAPVERHLHVHSDVQQHARPSLPLLGTH